MLPRYAHVAVRFDYACPDCVINSIVLPHERVSKVLRVNRVLIAHGSLNGWNGVNRIVVFRRREIGVSGPVHHFPESVEPRSVTWESHVFSVSFQSTTQPR